MKAGAQRSTSNRKRERASSRAAARHSKLGIGKGKTTAWEW
jgi:hypothetical protein